MQTQGRILIKQEEPRTTHSSVLGSVSYNRESVHLYRHLQHTALAMATEAPPTLLLNLLFVSGSHSEGRWLKGLGSVHPDCVELIAKHLLKKVKHEVQKGENQLNAL